MRVNCPLCDKSLKYIVYPGGNYTNYSYAMCECSCYHIEISKDNRIALERFDANDYSVNNDKFEFDRVSINFTENKTKITTYQWFPVQEIVIDEIFSFNSKEEIYKFIKNILLLK